MMRLGSLAFLWLAVSVFFELAFPQVARSQVPNPPLPALRGGAPDPQEGAHVVSTRELVKRLSRGRQLLSDQNFAEGARLLQSILESDEDAFFFPDQDNKSVERSLKLEAQTLIGQMPVEGREVYEKQYGPAARRLYEEAGRLNDTDGLAVVARRFFNTQSGFEAAYRLACDHLDHKRALTAALCFERLRAVPHAAARFEPYLSFKTALSWLQAGWPDTATAVLAEMKDRNNIRMLLLAGREVPLFGEPAGALAWLTALAGDHLSDAAAALEQWMLAGGDPRRNALSSGGSPYLNGGWRSSTTEGVSHSAESDAVVARAYRDRRPVVPSGADDSGGTPSIPTLQPLIVDDLAIVRSIGDIRAYDVKTGRIVWATGEKDQLLLEFLRNPAGPQALPPGAGPLAMLLANRTWEDTTFGTLSSDGEFVFAVEDLGIGVAGMMALPRMPGPRDYNRLVAYDVKTGRAMWEIGGPRGDAAGELEGSFFLGSPLVLDHRLYCLAESGSEVRLMVLDPQSGRLDWSQTISSSVPNGLNFFQRQSGLSPSFFGDILVCPVGADQLVAVDLTRRSLAWRHWLHSPNDLYDPRRQQVLLMQQQRLIAQQGGLLLDQNHWLDSLAPISDMRVIVTPRDANDVFCLNLLDGSLIWRKPRGEGLFVAGIHQGKVLIVGRSYVQALNLADGEPAWPEPASLPAPSGRGFVSGEVLHLPLVTAEVATIGLRDGRILARARSLAGNVPGNLVSVRGTIVSQGAEFVEAYRQVDTLESEIDTALARNADDAQALALRGEIELQRGKIAEAYADLKRALELKSDDATVRALLVGSLLEGLRVDFDAYRGLEADIEHILTQPDERSSYLWLKSQGLKRAGEPRAALATLLRFAETDVADRDLERLDGTLVVRRDRLVRARAAELYAAASAADRRDMDRDYRQRVAALSEKQDLAGVRRFLRYFGELADAVELERLSASLPSADGAWLEEEFQFEPLCASKDAVAAATSAVRMARLLLAAERPRDALAYIRRLERDWPDVVTLDGQTGRALGSELLNKPEMQRELALDLPWPTGLVEAERMLPVAGTPPGQRSFEIPLGGERAPFFADSVLHVSARWQDFFARDSFGRQFWKLSLEAPVQPINVQLNRAYACGHFVLISVGDQVFAIDTLGTADQPGARLLWKSTLSSSPGRVTGNMPRLGVNPRRPLRPFNRFGEQVGTIGPVTHEQVILLSGQKLMALDPLSGKPLWMREGIAAGTELFGDDEILYAVPPEPGPAVVYSALDGAILGNRMLPPAGRQRIDNLGRNIITWETHDGRQVLALRDPWSGQNLWSRSFDDTAQLNLVELDEAAVLELSGKLTIISLADGRVTFEAGTEPEPQVRQIHVLRSRDHYVLIANQVVGASMPDWVPVTPQAVAVRGRVYGFDRATQQRLWTQTIDRHGIDLNQPKNLPVLTFMSNFRVQKVAAPNQVENRCGLTCLDKRTGRVVFDDRRLDETLFFVDFAADADQKQLELRLFRSTVRLTFTDKPVPEP
jgi:outer membrane protein assembly factor BamB